MVAISSLFSAEAVGLSDTMVPAVPLPASIPASTEVKPVTSDAPGPLKRRRQKKVKAPEDANAAPKSLTAYQEFVKLKQDEVKIQNPLLSQKERMKVLGNLWKEEKRRQPTAEGKPAASEKQIGKSGKSSKSGETVPESNGKVGEGSALGSPVVSASLPPLLNKVVILPF